MQLNAAMKDKEYDERIFKTATGVPVEKLWKLYCAQLKGSLGESPEYLEMGCFRVALISHCKALRSWFRHKIT
jgi:hypothetical protein